MKVILIYITNPSRKEAVKIAEHLLQKKLIACANIYGKTEGLYRWKGKLARHGEYVLLAKTKSTNFGKVKEEVENMHSYTIPCIIKIPASANKKYFDWLMGEIK